ncbi:MAG: hypothetical protein JXM74_06225 [Fusobacteriaceae bacterium]|nr:hypothetical protein [Fusobacteriaceae bacterium]
MKLKKYLKTRLAHDVFLFSLIVCFLLMGFANFQKEVVVGLSAIAGLIFILSTCFPSSTEQIILMKFRNKLKALSKDNEEVLKVLKLLDQIDKEEN